MGSAICGGMISWSKFKRQKPDDINLMCFIRKREHIGKHYRYKIIDLLSDSYRWEDAR